MNVGVYTGPGLAADGFVRGAPPDGGLDDDPRRLPAFASADTDPPARARSLDAPPARTRDLAALADRHAGGRLLAPGGGGHDDGLAAACLAVVAALLD